jgi:hypothetical protein
MESWNRPGSFVSWPLSFLFILAGCSLHYGVVIIGGGMIH